MPHHRKCCEQGFSYKQVVDKDGYIRDTDEKEYCDICNGTTIDPVARYSLEYTTQNLSSETMFDLGWIDARCGKCLKVSRFGRTKMLKSETCPRCGADVDFWSLYSEFGHEAQLEEQRREYWASR